MFSVCVADVAPYYIICVVIVFLVLRDNGLYLITFENKVGSCAKGRQWCGIFFFPLRNSFNKTKTAIFLMQAVLPWSFPCFHLNSVSVI